MSVFTPVSVNDAQAFLEQYALGDLEALTPIAAGVENTNYFLDTTTGHYVLTLFETLSRQELEFYMPLMDHLAEKGLRVPRPQPRMHARHGFVESEAVLLERQLHVPAMADDWDFVGELNARPAAIVSKLAGVPRLDTHWEDCEAVGALLAQLHLAALDFGLVLDNWRDLAWAGQFASEAAARLSPRENALIADELAFQHALDDSALPTSVIHGDLFRDNVLWSEEGPGMIDFYFACNDAMVYDLAITANDFCCTPSATLDAVRVSALLQGYQRVRPLSAAESAAWPAMLRRAALRTWLGRLGYNHFPRTATHTVAKDHAFSEALLRYHVAVAAHVAA
jgi:homoserine kinase type II